MDILILQNDTGNTERILRLEDKTNNIGRIGDITSVSNILNVSHVIELKAEDVIYQKIISVVLGGDNGINLNSGMADNQSGTDSVILLAGDNSELHSPFLDS
jgi:arginase family enzyme